MLLMFGKEQAIGKVCSVQAGTQLPHLWVGSCLQPERPEQRCMRPRQAYQRMEVDISIQLPLRCVCCDVVYAHALRWVALGDVGE